jgi:predicted transcriptional regulator YheO
METRSELKKYFPIADYIAAINGKNCEVLIHDLSDLNHSICYIVNGHVTHRTVGGAITNFALELLQRKEYLEHDNVVNYTGTTKDGKKLLRSSTFFIKTGPSDVIGLLCVNIDITDLVRMQECVNDMLLLNQVHHPGSKTETDNTEQFDRSVDELVQEIIDKVVLEHGSRLVDSSIAEKKQLIGEMESRGVFKFKGAVNTVANVIGVSTQTIYRYLQHVGKKQEG